MGPSSADLKQALLSKQCLLLQSLEGWLWEPEDSWVDNGQQLPPPLLPYMPRPLANPQLYSEKMANME